MAEGASDSPIHGQRAAVWRKAVTTRSRKNVTVLPAEKQGIVSSGHRFSGAAQPRKAERLEPLRPWWRRGGGRPSAAKAFPEPRGIGTAEAVP